MVLIGASVCFRKADLITFYSFAGGALTLIVGALLGLGVIPPLPAVISINNVLTLLVSLTAIYNVLAGLCALGGVSFPRINLFSKKG